MCSIASPKAMPKGASSSFRAGTLAPPAYMPRSRSDEPLILAESLSLLFCFVCGTAHVCCPTDRQLICAGLRHQKQCQRAQAAHSELEHWHHLQEEETFTLQTVNKADSMCHIVAMNMCQFCCKIAAMSHPLLTQMYCCFCGFVPSHKKVTVAR